jgi:ABC-2 type transport system permease protein
MFYPILTSTWKDLKILFKDLGGVTTLFLMPAMFILVMSLALSGLFDSGNGGPIDILVVNQDSGVMGAALVNDLKTVGGFNVETDWQGTPLTRDRAEELIVAQKRSIAVIIPAGLTDAINRASFGTPAGQAATPVSIDLVVDPATSSQVLELVKGALVGLTQQAVSREMVPKGIDALFSYLAQSGTKVPSGVQSQFKRQALQDMGTQTDSLVNVVQTQPAGMHIEKFPNTVQQNVPGWTLFGVFFIAQQLASSILEEKKMGTFRRLLVAPMSRAAILLGKLAAYLTVNLIQIALMFAVGVLILPLVGLPRLELGAHPIGLILVSLAASLAATGLGLMLAALGKTSEQIGGLGTLLVITMAALGGVMVPRFVMPKFMQTLGLISPHAWAMAAYEDVLVRGYGVTRILPDIGALLIFAGVFFGVALWRFRWD